MFFTAILVTCALVYDRQDYATVACGETVLRTGSAFECRLMEPFARPILRSLRIDMASLEEARIECRPVPFADI